MMQEQVLSRLLSKISDTFDKSVGSFFYDINKPVSEEIAQISVRTEEILKNGFALTAMGIYLDNKVEEEKASVSIKTNYPAEMLLKMVASKYGLTLEN